MKDLIEEHIFAPKIVGRLLEANKKYLEGDCNSSADVVLSLQKIVDLYPKYIEKEDKRFFFPILDYFTMKDQNAILKEFWEFDKNMIHEKYKKLVEEYERG